MNTYKVVRVTNVSKGEGHEVGIVRAPGTDEAWDEAGELGLTPVWTTNRLELVDSEDVVPQTFSRNAILNCLAAGSGADVAQAVSVLIWADDEEIDNRAEALGL